MTKWDLYLALLTMRENGDLRQQSHPEVKEAAAEWCRTVHSRIEDLHTMILGRSHWR